MFMGEKIDEVKLLSEDFWSLLEFKLSIVVALQKHCRNKTTKRIKLFKQSAINSGKNM